MNISRLLKRENMGNLLRIYVREISVTDEGRKLWIKYLLNHIKLLESTEQTRIGSLGVLNVYTLSSYNDNLTKRVFVSTNFRRY